MVADSSGDENRLVAAAECVVGSGGARSLLDVSVAAFRLKSQPERV